MTPAYSSIDSDKVDLGELADYSIASSAIPVSISDSSGAITTFSTKHAVHHNDAFYAINQKLTLETDHAGMLDGKVTSVGTPANGVMSLTADTPMARMAVDQRVYPIYRNNALRHTVASAIDHWTQETGLLFDRVPGNIITYHSGYGHDYVYSQNPEYRPRVTTTSGSFSLGGRVMHTLPAGSTTKILAASVKPEAGRLPYTDNLPVPTAASGDLLVLSAGFNVTGSYTGTMTWFLSSARADQPGAQNVRLELVWSKSAGFSLFLVQTSGRTQLFSPTGALTEGNHRVLVALKANPSNSSQNMFTLRVINEAADTMLSNRSTAATTVLRGSQVQLSHVDVAVGASGSGAQWGLYGYFVSTMKETDLPAQALPRRKALSPTNYDVPLVPGFNGDVWTHVKQLLALHRHDLWYEDGVLLTGIRESAVRSIRSLGRVSPSLNQRTEAKFVEVVNQKMTAHRQVPRVMHASDSVYQVATGEVQVVNVQTEHSIDTVNDPTCVSGITPYPYVSGSGQYVITGSDGYIVSPSWWRDNGGSITARTTEREGEIEITIKGPDYDSPRAPYRVSEGDAGRPALYITGMGVTSEPETLKIPTGNPKAVADIGETLDSPFITSRALAYQAAVQVSLSYASPELKLSATEAKEAGDNGVLARRGAGALFEHEGSVYRVGSLTQTERANTFSEAVQYTTLRHRRDAFTGRTIRQANTDNKGRTIKDRALKPLVRP